jgi:hypothetical protein
MIPTMLLALLAHDFWIEPGTFTPGLGQRVGVRMMVGQDLLGDVVAIDPALVKQFVEPPRMSPPGLGIIGYESHPSPVELTGEKFNQYLKDEGLDSIPRQRPDAAVHELFSRCAKSLTLTGPVAPGQADRELGFRLELIAERSPYAMHEGDEIAFRLLWDKRPIAHTLVVAMSKADPAAKLSARSDAQGRVRFRLPHGGMWMVKAVHMIAAPAGINANWMSWWASETFEVPHAVTARK